MSKLENHDVVDQKLRKVLELIKEQSAIFSKQGSVVESWRVYRGQKCGPYYRLAFREGGRQRSIYLGTSKERAYQVRAVLASLQKPNTVAIGVKRARAKVLTELRRHKKDWDRLLREHGLYLKGFEVRGWADKAGVLNAVRDRESTNQA